ncbi:MAG: TIGR03936 family radical SAM-associated protein [Candidatus Hydrothermia bacterium]
MTNHPFGAFLLSVEKPGRYLGTEFNAVRKEITVSTIHVGLMYPEIYEIGMSNLGLKIIYHIFNQVDGVYAERVFLPWVDAIEKMRENGIPLFTLETYTPVKDLDLFGVSLHTELNYTNLLLALDLSEIPIFREERIYSSEYPLILVGGPAALNPLPLEPFVDFFAVGEGENIVKDLIPFLREYKRGNISKIEFLQGVSSIDGIYVPGISRGAKRAVAGFNIEDFPINQIVPNIEAVHNRFVIEVMRGCTRGCRFCEGGFTYRPLRVRDPDDVIKIVREGINKTGFDEVGLLAFSVSDYPYLEDLIRYFKTRFDNLHVSLPSLPINALNEGLLSEFEDLRRFGITLAPEVASEKLRKKINKNVPLSEIYSSIDTAYKYNFKHVKLYLMIGLPGETQEDLTELIHFLTDLSRRFRRITFRVSISPFVPRPHTPFQYSAQESLESLEEKIKFIKSSLMSFKNLEVSFHDPKMSILEGILGRGDALLSKVLLEAYKNGAIFDSRSEFFKFETYEKAFEKFNIDYTEYLRERPLDKPLPWDLIDTGVFKRYLRKEYNKSLVPDFTADCSKEKCTGCGEWGKKGYEVCTRGLMLYEKRTFEPDLKNNREVKENHGYLLVYSVIDKARFLSQRDTVRIIIHLLKVAGVSITYTQGFVPRPKISMPNPLPLGVESLEEFLYFESQKIENTNEIIEKLNSIAPLGLRFMYFSTISKKPSWGELSKAILEFQIGNKWETVEVDLSTSSIPRVLKEKYGIEREQIPYVHLRKLKVLKSP